MSRVSLARPDSVTFSSRRRIVGIAALVLAVGVGCGTGDDESTTSTTSTTTTSSTTSTTTAGTTDSTDIGPPAIEGEFDEVAPKILEALQDQGDTCDTALLLQQLADMPPPTTPEQTEMVVKIISTGYLAMSRIIDQSATAEVEMLQKASADVLDQSDAWAENPDDFIDNLDRLNQPLIPAFKEFNTVLDDCVLGGVNGGVPDGVPDASTTTPSTTSGSAA